ncbi:uncharacterized protein KY384_000507 [Bacidia gigantensis]|uniref:uncharacterized protein n=1 Tax=Bacidia gigantensis TaxID=2732470 RepID=UPI001D039B59|nr:uncharacterized protein KY384_000507 [Bacidia gigantensis]KAG8525747.1 hypothetical protein KY384_000507 [Bacidia gigantensis]
MADRVRVGNTNIQSPLNGSQSQTMSPIGQGGNPFDMTAALNALPKGSENGGRPDQEFSGIRIRRLPHNYDHAQLRSLLTFAEKLESTEFVATTPGDQGFKTAIARFYSLGAAQQAQSILDGKQIDPEKPRLMIDILRMSPGSIGSERPSFDLAATRAHSGSSNGSSSLFSGQFQSMNRISPPQPNGYSQPPSTSEHYFQNGRQRVSGRDVIGQDGPDEETSDLLRDPVGYATNGMNGLSRRNTGSSRSTTQYNSLSLNTSNPSSPPLPGYTSPQSNGFRSPVSTMQSNGISAQSYQVRHQQFQRTHMPPVNPADQNPPCNTLYIGNLPIDTSEDELKQMFSRCRGYKRLCFRTKSNGPMCFVEFEDISFATKALNDLYGIPLHNSGNRGGIRVSFSKNPLGVRSGQPGGMGGPPTPLSPTGQFPGMNGVNMGAFSTASGPPPGIPTPPGLPMTNGTQNNVMSPTSPPFNTHAMSPTGMGYGMTGMGAMNGAPPMSPYGAANGGGGWYGDYEESGRSRATRNHA